MSDMTLRPSPTDSDLYALSRIGSFRWETTKRPFVAAAQAGESRWRFAQCGTLRQHANVTDDAGVEIARYRTRGWTRSGGTIHWEGRELKLRPAAIFHISFTLDDGERSIAALRSNAAGEVVVSADDVADIDAGPLLLAAFVVRAQILCTVPAGI
jgi:hypothetical protein